ncbi:MAG: peptide ABC transporter substrate-binding protein [Gammaproteobacteria bacterium]|nr:peptide ABC transporter substrate-binding protein [Gammaproteobacteria bacterium]
MKRFCHRLAVGSVFALAGICSAGPDTAVLNIGNSAEPGTLDPHRYFSNAEEHILKDLFMGLTTMGPGAEVLPGVAKSWEVSEDGLQWRFKLDPTATWSDGHPLTAHDFVFGLQRHQDPTTAAPLASFLYCIKNARAVNDGSLPPSELGVGAVDDHTLLIELAHPFPFLPERLLYPIGYPIPKHVVDEHADQWVKAQNWVSNGAYVLDEWRPREYVALKRNEHFKREPAAAIGKVRYYPLSEPATAYNRFVAGDMDIVHGYPHNLIDKVRRERPHEVHNVPLQSIMYLVFNTKKAPFDRVRVRKALSLAIDKRRLVESILGAGEQASASFAPPIVAHYATRIAPHVPSTKEALTLLESAGFNEANPLKLTLRYISSEENKRVYVAIAAMWKAAGIATTLHQANLATHFSDLQSGDFEVAQAGWFGENNPEHYLELLWSKIGPANYGSYASKEFDSLFEKARATANVHARVATLAEAERIALQEHPVIPLYVNVTLNLVKAHVAGWTPNGRNLHPVRFLHWQ